MVVQEAPDGKYIRQITDKSLDELPENEVLIKVQYSSLNYKDGLSATGHRGVTKNYPHTPGVNATGIVEQSFNEAFQAVGGEIKDFFLVTGRYDMVMISEAPDHETGVKLALAIGSAGAVRTETLSAFTEDEYRQIIASLP